MISVLISAILWEILRGAIYGIATGIFLSMCLVRMSDVSFTKLIVYWSMKRAEYREKK